MNFTLGLKFIFLLAKASHMVMSNYKGEREVESYHLSKGRETECLVNVIQKTCHN